MGGRSAILKELGELVEREVVDAATAERIRHHYAQKSPGRNTLLLVFGVLGALLIGLGIVLLLAHNWHAISRPLRTVIALLPLLAGQGLAAYAVMRRPDSAAWRESSAIFVSLALLAALALVSQTYHIHNDLDVFLLLWLLPTLPLVYLVSATAPAMIYVIGIAGWCLAALDNRHEALWFWPLWVMVLPHLYQCRRSNRGLLLGWLVAASGMVGLFAFEQIGEILLTAAGTYAAVIYLAGKNSNPAGRAFAQIGFTVLLGLAYLFSFQKPWEPMGQQMMKAGFAEYALLAVLGCTWAGLLLGRFKRLDPAAILAAGLPLLIWPVLLGLTAHQSQLMALLVNIYLLALGLLVLREGLRHGGIGTVNLGMLILCGQIIVRFFDADLSFMTRGLAFIAMGLLFLLANLYLVRRRA